MTEHELERIAARKRILYLGRDYTGMRRYLHEMRHYFNIIDQELGYTVDWCDEVKLFEPPRIWDERFFKDYETINLR